MASSVSTDARLSDSITFNKSCFLRYRSSPSQSCRYNREEVVRSLGKEVNLNPPLTLGQLPDTPEELLKLDQVFIKSELKVGVIYVKEVSQLDPAAASCFRRQLCFLES